MNQNVFDELNRQKILLRKKVKKYEYHKKNDKRKKIRYDESKNNT